MYAWEASEVASPIPRILNPTTFVIDFHVRSYKVIPDHRQINRRKNGNGSVGMEGERGRRDIIVDSFRTQVQRRTVYETARFTVPEVMEIP